LVFLAYDCVTCGFNQKKKKKKKKKKKTADRHAAVTADNRNRRVGWADSLASLGATVPPRPGAAGRAVRDAWAITTARTAEDEAGLECWGRYVRREGGGGKGKKKKKKKKLHHTHTLAKHR
jgi:hypothetical protein